MLEGTQVFVCVYRLPEKLTNGFCFGDGVPIAFRNVDWFYHVLERGREDLEKWIRSKRYCTPGKYLVLTDHPDLTFTFVR